MGMSGLSGIYHELLFTGRQGWIVPKSTPKGGLSQQTWQIPSGACQVVRFYSIAGVMQLGQETAQLVVKITMSSDIRVNGAVHSPDRRTLYPGNYRDKASICQLRQ